MSEYRYECPNGHRWNVGKHQSPNICPSCDYMPSEDGRGPIIDYQQPHFHVEVVGAGQTPESDQGDFPIFLSEGEVAENVCIGLAAAAQYFTQPVVVVWTCGGSRCDGPREETR